MEYELAVLSTLVAALLAALAQYTFKRYLNKFGFSLQGLKSIISNKHMLAGVVLYVVSLGFYFFALAHGELSFIYPIFASSFVFVLLISIFALKEEMSAYRIAGLLLIVLGIAMIGLSY